MRGIRNEQCTYEYYETFYILFRTEMRISEFCGLTLKDVDMKNRVIDIKNSLLDMRNEQPFPVQRPYSVKNPFLSWK